MSLHSVAASKAHSTPFALTQPVAGRATDSAAEGGAAVTNRLADLIRKPKPTLAATNAQAVNQDKEMEKERGEEKQAAAVAVAVAGDSGAMQPAAAAGGRSSAAGSGRTGASSGPLVSFDEMIFVPTPSSGRGEGGSGGGQRSRSQQQRSGQWTGAAATPSKRASRALAAGGTGSGGGKAIKAEGGRGQTQEDVLQGGELKQTPLQGRRLVS